MDDHWRPRPLEIAGGAVLGFEGPPGDLEAPHPRQTPLQALEAVIVPHLERTPCLVAFSGGRDSSLVLACAVRAARRNGLAEPVPVTHRYPAVPSTHEDHWQELVIRHLGVTEWVKLVHDDDGDLVGPNAATSLRRHGILWPPAIHIAEPLRAMAAGGVILTGEGGDAWLGERRIAPIRYLLKRRGRIRRHQATRVAVAFLPNAVRRFQLRRASWRDDDWSWLRPAARRRFISEISRDLTSEPLRWNRSLDWLGRHRVWRAGAESRALVARHHDTTYADVLQNPRFVHSLKAAGGAWGFTGRTELLERCFAGLLPRDVMRRQDKARFDGAYFNRHTREFVARWDGGGVDGELVDPEALSLMWRDGHFTSWTAMLLQAAWLHDARPCPAVTPPCG